MAYRPTEEAPTERLLHIALEGRQTWGGDHRHIRATVVRRAMSHKPRENGSLEYWDDTNASGYRCADFSNSTERGVYVRDLTLRGQIDAYRHDKLNEGKPYANEVKFYPHNVSAREAELMTKTFARLSSMYKRLTEAGHVFNNDSFAGMARQFALSLGIKKCIVLRKGLPHASYSEGLHSFVEFGIADLPYHVDALLDRIKEGS